ncbi:MAG: zinc metallopeptidase [Clostridia bacterium]|nr:zinc metallopeptidase [Clostridia bacterium]MBR3552354.1 zinc metallopeptidase [Clostridia bacterium]
MYGYFIDYYYIILVVPAMLLSLLAQAWVKGAYRKYSKIDNARRLTGEMAAQAVLRSYGITDVRIEPVAGNLTDHYDPRSNVIRLSEGVFAGTSIAAVGIACHEAGHAAQHAQNYVPIKVRNTILPVANIGSSGGIMLAVLGLVWGFDILVLIGIVLFMFVVLFQLVTLPVEFDASSRAMKIIGESNLLEDDEKKGARKVLTAAAMTYVAALIVSIASLLRLVLRAQGRRR